MRKKTSVAFSCSVFLAVACASPAVAQYHAYATGTKPVEVDLSVLDDISQRKNLDTRTHSFVPTPAPVMEMPLQLAADPAPTPAMHPAEQITGETPNSFVPEMPTILSRPAPAADVPMAETLSPPPPPPRAFKPQTAPLYPTYMTQPGAASTQPHEAHVPPVPVPRIHKPIPGLTEHSTGHSRTEAPAPLPPPDSAVTDTPVSLLPEKEVTKDSKPHHVALPVPKPDTAPSPLPPAETVMTHDDVAPVIEETADKEPEQELPAQDVTEEIKWDDAETAKSAEAPAVEPQEQAAEEKAPETMAPTAEMEAQETEVTPATSAVPSMEDLSVTFDGNSSELTAEAVEKLKQLLPHLTEAPDTRLQIRAYATGEDGGKSSARRISLSRALMVRSFLMDNGIKPTRVDVRALGVETDRSPLDRVDILFAR